MYGLTRTAMMAAFAATVCAWTGPGFAQEISESGGTLVIRGDRDREELTLTGGLPGEVIITDSEGAEVDTFSDIDQIVVDLRGGADSLTLSNLALDGGFIGVKMGLDDDDLIVTGVLDADVSLDGEAGDDLIDLSGGTTVTGDLAVYGGLRDDLINLETAVVTGDLLVDAQAGDDELQFSSLIVDGRSRFDLGVGADFALGSAAIFGDDVEIIAGLGNDDIVNSGNTYDADLFVDLRGGDDDYAELGSTVQGDYHVDGGAGDDDFDDAGTVVVGSRTTTSV